LSFDSIDFIIDVSKSNWCERKFGELTTRLPLFASSSFLVLPAIFPPVLEKLFSQVSSVQIPLKSIDYNLEKRQ
jgi:hypothetical protein